MVVAAGSCSDGGSAEQAGFYKCLGQLSSVVDPGGRVLWETLFTPLLLFNSGVAVFSCSY